MNARYLLEYFSSYNSGIYINKYGRMEGGNNNATGYYKYKYRVE